MEITINTERLILRTIRKSDDKDVFEYSRNPDVGIHAGWKAHESIEETRKIMEEIFIDKPGIYGIVLRETGKLIGSVGILSDPKRENPNAAMLGYAMGKEYWGKGYMTEAAKAVIWHGFTADGCDIISAYCYPYNKKSHRVIEKCGMKYEGTLRKCEARFDGQVLDNDCYSVTREEFEKSNAQNC